MNASSTSTATPQMIPTDVVPQFERRSAPRIDCHTVVTAVAPHNSTNEGQSQVIKAHSQDVSVGGAKLIAQHPLPSKRLFLRFLLPTFGDRYVEAEVVNESIREKRSLTGEVTQQYAYGVRFTGILSDGEMVNQVVPSPANQQPQSAERE